MAQLRFLPGTGPTDSADKVFMEERRSEVRLMCADMVEVWWKDVHGRLEQVTGLLEDISPSGTCLQLDVAVPLGTSLCWRKQGQEFAGHVRYCVYREIGYFVGVEFEPESKWSKRAYEPPHLLETISEGD